MPIMVMMVMQSYKLTLIVLLLGGLLCISGSAWASSGDDSSDQTTGQENCRSRFSYENDMTYSTDKNYTFGLLGGRSCASTTTLTTEEKKKYSFSPLNSPILNSIVTFEDDAELTVSNSSYFGVLAYTPNDIGLGHNGRPYASIAFYADGLLYADDNFAIQRQFSIGALGTSFAGQAQKKVHRSLGYVQPNGWSSQISDGGEPTFLYSLTVKEKMLDRKIFNLDYDFSNQFSGSIGYYTHLKIATTFRFGRTEDVPFWSDFNSIHNTTPAAPAATLISNKKTNGNPSPEKLDLKDGTFLFLTGGIDLVAYNATLQGQFRDNDNEISSSDVERAIGSVTLGFYSFIPYTKLSASISLSRRSKEVRDGSAHSWIGINLYW